ncbi:MAG: DNA translocase FtsK, partial [Clostridia bacterium]|nr:DNA translocase FtsK [Clostridia bacterium]
TGLADDIALNLAAAGVRIEAPIPNKAAVGIEVPNRASATVGVREIIESSSFTASKSKLTIALGRDIGGNVVVGDIAKMPHGLIAGATGSGKSVCVNSMIVSILYKATPDEVKLLMIDPKVVELREYNGIPHLLVPVVTDPKKAAGALGWAVMEMEKRYAMFADRGVRDIDGYNRFVDTLRDEPEVKRLPHIVIIIDELADLMMTAPNEVEDSINRIAAKARAAGMHLLIATQRPSVDVVTGVIKANIPTRIAFAVSSQIDSRTILDYSGAEKLLGKGDMLYSPLGASKATRIQGCYVSEKEVQKVVDFVKNSSQSDYDDDIMYEIERQAAIEKSKKTGLPEDAPGDDPLLNDAILCVIEMGQASTSLLQRKLKLGYARAARIVDEMEARGVVGPYEGSKPRRVLITKDQFMEQQATVSDDE